jgi:hypothetical protein
MKARNENSISAIYPIQEVTNDGLIINGSGEITFSYRLELPEVYTLTAENYEAINGFLEGVISRLKDGCCIHKQDIYYLSEFDFSKEDNNNYNKQRNLEHFHLKPQLNHYCNIYFTYSRFKHIKDGISYFENSLFKLQDYFFKQPFKDFEKDLEIAYKESDLFESFFKTNKNFKIKRLNREEIIVELAKCWNYNYSDKPLTNLELDPISIDKDSLRIGNKYVGVVSLKQEGTSFDAYGKPVTVDPSSFSENIAINTDVGLNTSFTLPIALGLPVNHVVNTIIEAVDQEKTYNKLQKEIKNLKVLTAFKNVSAENKAIETETFSQFVSSENHKMVLLKQNVVLFNEDKKVLQDNINNTIIAYGNINGCIGFPENRQAGNLHLLSQPGNVKGNFRALLTVGGGAACMLPIETHINKDVNGLLFHDRFDRVVTMDLFNNKKVPNRNFLCFGPSGSGKSVFLNNYADDFIQKGGHFIVMDKGGSFKQLFDLTGGLYIDTSEIKDLSFNIFLCQQDKDGNYIISFEDDDEVKDKVNFIIAVLQRIWKKESRLTDDESNILRKIIPAFYDYINENRIFPTLNEFEKYLSIYEDTKMHEKDKELISLHSFKNALGPYIKGGDFESFLNSDSNIDIKKQRIVGFDMEGIESNEMLYDIMSYIVVDLASDKIMNLPFSVPKMLLVDEAVDFLEGHTGEFIAGQARKIRKKGGAVGIATQDVAFLDNVSKLVKDSLITNAGTKILLGLGGSPTAAQSAQKFLSLLDSDLELVNSLKGREFFIKVGIYSYVLELKLGPHALWSYSTTPEDIDVKSKYFNKPQYKDNASLAIDQIVEDYEK